jgi:DNA polymerase III subunit epsilon
MSDPERDLPAGDRQDPDPRAPWRTSEHWWERPLVVIDTETTSADPLEARIVQIACLAVYPDGRLSPSSYQTIVNPGVPIPAEAVAIHGINTARAAAEGVSLEDALYQVLRRLDRWNRASPVVIYNVPYDWPLLWAELDRTSLVWTDPLANARLVDPLLIERTFNGVAAGNYTHTLAQVRRRYGLEETSAHDAQADALSAAAILRTQLARYPALQRLSLEALQHAQREWFAQWRDALNAYFERKGQSKHVTGEWPFGDAAPIPPRRDP